VQPLNWNDHSNFLFQLLRYLLHVFSVIVEGISYVIRTQSKIATALLYGVVNPAVILFASATIVGLLDCALVVGCKYGNNAAACLSRCF